MKTKDYYMNKCLIEAKKAIKYGDVPIGSIIVDNESGKIISRGFNKKYKKKDSTCHAEIESIKKAFKKKKSIYLENCTIYVTLEPCIMCLGAIINARIKNIVVGTYQTSKKKYTLRYDDYNIKIENLDYLECKEILSSFFTKKR